MLLRIAEALGIPVVPLAFVSGLALGAAPAALAAYRVGHWLGDRAGFTRGFDDAGHQAELNALSQKLAAAKADKAVADAASAQACANEAAAASARTTAEEALDAYRHDLARRPRGACALDDADLDRLRADHYRRVPAGRGGAGPAHGR